MIFDEIPRITISFYKYVFIEKPKIFRDELYKIFSRFNVFGRIYIAFEGINAQISIPKKLYFKVISLIKTRFSILSDVDLNLALDDRKSFWVLRMKVRSKLLSDDLPSNFFNSKNVGKYLLAKEVNYMLDRKDSICVDMRNHYEYRIGHFDKAVNIPVNTFKEQLLKIVDFLKDYKDKNIIMYCTGGIRCEKSTAWIKYNGFKHVYHIKGGIIKYVRDAKKDNLSLKFKGKNFVFDERISEKVSEDILGKCDQCGSLCDRYVNCFNSFCHTLFIQCNKCYEKFYNCCSKQCMKILLNS